MSVSVASEPGPDMRTAMGGSAFAVDRPARIDLRAVIPVRTCIGCRRTAAKPYLVRLVWDAAAGAVRADRRQVLPGRGCYLHPGCGAAAMKRRAVGRALRRVVDGEQVATLLAAEGLT